MSIFSKLAKTLRRASEFRGRAHAHQQLLRMSDRQLADFGLSKVLLLEGVGAWPWRVRTNTDQAIDLRAVVSAKQEKPINAKKYTSREIRQAVNELNAYSDRELIEMGITRGSIREVVRSGRSTVEGMVDERKRAA